MSYNPNWQKIYAELEVGSPDESTRYLLFTAAQRHQLNEMSAAYFGCSLLMTSFKGSRKEVSHYSRDDKLASIKPDEQYLLIKPQPLFTAVASDLALRVPLDQIIKLLESPDNTITHVVVVENLDAFDYWNEFSVTADLRQALVVYRGHDALAKGVKVLLQRLPKTIEVVAFVDVDPDGIKIALTTPKATQILSSDFNSLSLLIKSSSYSKDFDKQHKAVNYMQKHPDHWPSLQQFIIERRVSIKQQHLLAFEVPLIMHNRKS
ncbi:hypothetical protein FS418_05570 [Shewanella sp. YLB-09]|uniref:DUF7281 domain-containing protein n=1 Tax=Shewanella sp. YLB-09 TaxID=2601269 RepID=UPI00115D200B|nr:hypothetical protein [Shewanella sp. YLB-09]QFU21389.1 hypothetical protein FS418_05570 [Shewanella sp. YLB-09]